MNIILITLLVPSCKEFPSIIHCYYKPKLWAVLLMTKLDPQLHYLSMFPFIIVFPFGSYCPHT